MFSLSHEVAGQTVPVVSLTIEDVGKPLSTVATFVSSSASPSLVWDGPEATVSFDGSPFPLSGADFLTPVTGALSITVTETLAFGLHLAALRCQSSLSLRCGHGLCGGGQGGRLATLQQTVPVIIRVQSLSTSSGTASASSETVRPVHIILS